MTHCYHTTALLDEIFLLQASNLLTVFLTFGAPKILQSDNGRQPRHPQSQESLERSNQDVENMLYALWMKDNKTEKWSIASYKKLTVEEDFEEIYSKYENENIKQDILVNYCKMCENEFREDVFDLCKTNYAIYEERKAEHKGQEKAAEKMLQVLGSNVVIPALKINDCIKISVPKVDR
ncbi:hypothetical protein AGLY_012281 [Aphis glycines]|uniref:Uncharacterized protein n=1 Tax=Aphis glycines TaxID=307491 RepID=A0A6G0T9T0_APHGL|nr:hypothetical protein AGLY_012281 [Aphis glycines]